MRVLLFGANDLSLAVAEAVHDLRPTVDLAGVVHVPEVFPISYQPGGVVNARHRDLGSWSRERGLPEQQWSGPDDAARFARDCGADVGVAAGWYHMLPRRLRDTLRHGMLGAHASLLPLFRGGAPLNWALLSGATETGLTVFRLEDGVDTGPILSQARVPIAARTTIAELVAWVAETTVDQLRQVLPALAQGQAHAVEQTGRPSYSLMRLPEDGALDWRQPAEHLDRLVRAVGRPYPGASTSWRGQSLTVWACEPRDDVAVHGMPGQLARVPESSAPLVVTGRGVLALLEVTRADGSDVVPDLLRGGHQRLDVVPSPQD